MKYLLHRQRIISLLCIISVILGMSAVSPKSIHAETATVTSGPYTFVKHGNRIQLSGYNESKNPTGDVCLEKTYRSSDENFWVTGIQETVFQEKSLSSLIVNLTNRTETEYYRIADKAFLGTKIGLFSGGSGSKAVFQGGAISSIGHNAFKGTKIKGDLIFDKINGRIYSYAFYNMEVAGKLVIKGSLNCLDDYALAGAKMKELYLTADIKEIGTCAFKDTPIREFPLPDALTKLGSKVFEGCVLEKIILPSSDQKREIAEDAFPDQSGLTIVIPKGLTDLSVFHFENYKNLTFQTNKSLSEDSPVICWLKEHNLTYKVGENGPLVTPGDISEPTTAPTPTETPTITPTITPTETPIPAPTEIPTEIPIVIPTEKPTETPTTKPTEKPTETPTTKPTEKPTETPAVALVETPSIQLTQTSTQVSQSQITSSETPTPIVTPEPTEETSLTATASPKKSGHINKKIKVKFKLNNSGAVAATSEPTEETSLTATASPKKSKHINEKAKVKFKLNNNSAIAATPEPTEETSPAATASLKKSGHINQEIKYKLNNRTVAVTDVSKKTLKKSETVSVGNHVKNAGDEVSANHPKLKKIQFGTDSTKLAKEGAPPRQEADKEQEAVTQCYETAVFQNGFS